MTSYSISRLSNRELRRMGLKRIQSAPLRWDQAPEPFVEGEGMYDPEDPLNWFPPHYGNRHGEAFSL
jgi:hypothetical protein